MRYRIGAEVSGGVTGFRSGHVKNKDGEIETYETEQEARTVAEEMNRRMNSPRATARFRYWG